MLVTAQKLDESLHKIRDIDFSAFYREVQFSDPDKGINREMIMKEIMPDIILMPNAGTRSMMWQETAGVRRDTSARFLFPIFTAVDIDDMMVDTVGRYRWEICRKIQGVHWNDIREVPDGGVLRLSAVLPEEPRAFHRGEGEDQECALAWKK